MPISGIDTRTPLAAPKTKTDKTGDQAPSNSRAPASDTLNMDDFMRLLAVQFQNQDMSNPMSNSEMMGQLTSMATVQAMNTFTELSTTQYAVGMIGQKVQVVQPKGSEDNKDEADKTKTDDKLDKKVGIVTGIDLAAMKVYLDNSKTGYSIGQIMQVGTVPEPDPEKPEDPKPEDPKPEDPKPEDPSKPEGGTDTKTPKTRMAGIDSTLPQDKNEALDNSGYIPEDKRAALDNRDSAANDKTSAIQRPVTGPGAGLGTEQQKPSNQRPVTGPGASI